MNSSEEHILRSKDSFSATRKSAITKFPSFMCILLCRNKGDDNGTISSAVEFPAIGFNINEGHTSYDLSATVHYKLTKRGNGRYTGHYTAITKSRDLQSQQWFMYDDDKVSSSIITNKNTMVKKSYTKTATILFYISPSIDTRINNAKTIDLMEGGKEIDGDGEEGNAEGSSGDVPNGVKDIADIDRDGKEGNAVQTDSEKNPVKDRVDIRVDGEEGKADGSSDKNDKKDDEEEEGEIGEIDTSSGSESSSSSVLLRRPPRRRRHPYVLTLTDSSDSSPDSSDSSSSAPHQNSPTPLERAAHE
jgi:hypothetical protein